MSPKWNLIGYSDKSAKYETHLGIFTRWAKDEISFDFSARWAKIPLKLNTYDGYIKASKVAKVTDFTGNFFALGHHLEEAGLAGVGVELDVRHTLSPGRGGDQPQGRHHNRYHKVLQTRDTRLLYVSWIQVSEGIEFNAATLNHITAS